jgi:hypothetical protein
VLGKSRYVNVVLWSLLRSVFYLVDNVVWNLGEKLTAHVIKLNVVNRLFTFSFI